MPNIGQYEFSHKEVTIALIKEAGIHEGKWVIAFNISTTAFVGGLGGAKEAKPSVISVIESAALIKAAEGAPENLLVDAAEVNPKSTGSDYSDQDDPKTNPHPI